MIHKTVREIAGAWKEYKRPYVKQSTMAAYVLDVYKRQESDHLQPCQNEYAVARHQIQ